ncbi:hypothetical protein HGRIS_005378 [Hohenbuehelia grisea]|uniref:Uncharacterized protein n=1 Tax=Hohenbuehelia grisea TaxID=104357 RepID=A0ABR3JGG7_9AGAR
MAATQEVTERLADVSGLPVVVPKHNVYVSASQSKMSSRTIGLIVGLYFACIALLMASCYIVSRCRHRLRENSDRASALEPGIDPYIISVSDPQARRAALRAGILTMQNELNQLRQHRDSMDGVRPESELDVAVPDNPEHFSAVESIQYTHELPATDITPHDTTLPDKVISSPISYRGH